MSKISDSIWFTRKARIQASERLLHNDNHSQILLVFYSIIITCLSVILVKKSAFLGNNTDLILVVMSINVLVTSLFVANKNFKGRALSLKGHYIELQKLYYEAIEAEEKGGDTKYIRESYIKLLELEENHKTIDDIVFRVFNENAISTRKPNLKEKFSAYYYKSMRLLILVLLYASPIIAIYAMSFV